MKRRPPKGAAKFEAAISRIVQDFARNAVARPKPKRKQKKQQQPARRDARTLKQATEDFQRGFVFDALQQHAFKERWNISATAQQLEIARSHLYRLIEELGLGQILADRIRAERSIGLRR